MAHTSNDPEFIEKTHNTARFFVEQKHIAWVLLVATMVWGVYGYVEMPKRKDPQFPVNFAAAICTWPGASAEKIEQLVTPKIEESVRQNPKVSNVFSISQGSVSLVFVELDEEVADVAREFQDITLRLDAIKDLPEGAGPIEFLKDYGDTAALMLTVASPRVRDIELSLRARSLREAIDQARRAAGRSEGAHSAVIINFAQSISPRIPQRQRDVIATFLQERGIGDIRSIEGAGFVGLDAATDLDDTTILALVHEAMTERLHPSQFHPDTWQPVVIRTLEDTEAKLAAVAGDRYSYGELDKFTDLIKRTLQAAPEVSKVSRAGVLNEAVYLEYSQERLASIGIQQTRLRDILQARNTTLPGGVLEIGGRNLAIEPSGEFKNETEIGNVIVGTSASGTPVYLRDGVEIIRGYESPARYLNFFHWRDPAGHWRRSRAITLAIQLRPGVQIGEFGEAVNRILAELRRRMPEDLILARTSDQPLQATENVNLFMRSLYEAVVLVVLVTLVGFGEWRSALLIALSIPLTLAMTVGGMHLLGLDLQQVSIASLIIALGLLVDDPVVAGDAIKRELEAGHSRTVAAWLGPTKLATAILYATITVILAYLPLLIVSGHTGRFIYSLPIVLACALVASRIVSMTFVPLLGSHLLRPSRRPEVSREERRQKGFSAVYYKMAGRAIDHRWLVLGLSVIFLIVALGFVRGLKNQYFPTDLSYLSYVDLWLPEGTTLTATNEAAQAAERIIGDVAAQYGREHAAEDGPPREVLRSITTFVGGGGPRFWFSVFPELQQLNYAQLIIQVDDRHDTQRLVEPLQRALAAGVPGARLDVRQLETSRAVGVPVAIRVSGDDIGTLRQLGERLKTILRSSGKSDRVRDDWGGESFVVKLQVDPDRSNFAGVSNAAVAISSAAGISGYRVTSLREGGKQVPVVARLRMEERAHISDIQNLYVYALEGKQPVPLRQVSSLDYQMETEKILRRNQFRTMTVSAFSVPGALPSEVLNEVRPQLTEFERALPPGFSMDIGGEEEAQVKGFDDLRVVMAVSLALIYLALVFQFKNVIKPLIVFSAIPYGLVGALALLAIMDSPFGFMAFLGVAALVVIGLALIVLTPAKLPVERVSAAVV